MCIDEVWVRPQSPGLDQFDPYYGARPTWEPLVRFSYGECYTKDHCNYIWNLADANARNREEVEILDSVHGERLRQLYELGGNK